MGKEKKEICNVVMMTNHDKASMAVSSIFSQVPLRAKLLMVTCSNATEHSKVCSAHVPLTW